MLLCNQQVTLSQAQLIHGCLGWDTSLQADTPSWYVTSHLGKLSLLSFHGRLIQWRRHGGAFQAIAPPPRRRSSPLKIWNTHKPVTNHLMTGGRFSQIVHPVPYPLLSPPFTPPIPSLPLFLLLSFPPSFPFPPPFLLPNLPLPLHSLLPA